MSDPLGPPFTLKQLTYFVAAADEGTIAGAAERLFVSPSALSDAITELERAMGERLSVRRRARGFNLTPVGEQFVEHARRILHDSAEATRLVRGGEELSGPVALGCFPTLGPTILPPLLQGFGAAHPEVSLSIREADQDQLLSDLAAGRIDVAFVYDMLVPGHPQRAHLYELAAHVVLSAGHRLAGSDAVDLAELVDEDLILFDAAPSGDHTLSLFTEQGLRPRIRHRTAGFEVVRTLVARGLGYGILVSHVNNSHSYEGLPLVEKRIRPPVRPVAVDAIWAEERPLTERTRAVIDFARTIPWGEAVE